MKGPILYFIIVCGLVEGSFISTMLKRKFWLAIIVSLIINGISLLVSLWVWPYIFPTGFDFADLTFGAYFLLWLAAVIPETFLLKAFYYKQSFMKAIITSVSMNIASYTILYVVFYYINQ